MTKFRALLVGAVLSALALGYALGQTVATFSLTGNEVVSMAIGGPGGPSVFVTSSALRGTSGYITTALTSGSITLTNNQNRLLTTAVVSGALTVTAPPNPYDGENFELLNTSSGANTATVTFTANTGQTVTSGAVATQAQNTSAEWMYIAATTTWARMR